VQRPRLRPGGARLQPTQRGRTRQRLVTTHGRLHDQIVAQPSVIVQILVATAQPVHALRQHRAQRMTDAPRVPRIAQLRGRRARQPDALIDLPQQHQPPVARQIPAREIRLDHATPKLAEIDPTAGTLCHGEASSQTSANAWKASGFGGFAS
jgi:hypothetical protein